MALADIKGGKFLYELLPYLFPEGYLSEEEIILWNFYYSEKAESIKSKWKR